MEQWRLNRAFAKGMATATLLLPLMAVAFSLIDTWGNWVGWELFWQGFGAAGTVGAFFTAVIVYLKNREAEHSRL